MTSPLETVAVSSTRGCENEPVSTTMQRRSCWVLCLVALLCGCGTKEQPKPWGKVGYSGGLHGYKLEAEGPGAFIQTNGRDDPVLMVAGKKIAIQKEQILVDGLTKAKIPPDAKSIGAIWHDDEIVVDVDGKEVFKLGP
jgi:hypothetical protein